LLTEVDVALVGNPIDDRLIVRGDGVRRMSFPSRTSDYPSELITEARRRAGVGYDSKPVIARRAHEAARRQAYFERADDGWWDMLPYRRLRQFVDAVGASSRADHQELLQEVVTAISMYEGMTEETLACSALWLATTDEATEDFGSFRRFPIGDFYLRPVELTA